MSFAGGPQFRSCSCQDLASALDLLGNFELTLLLSRSYSGFFRPPVIILDS